MTQPVHTLAPVITGAPIITAPPANLAEPTMEELAALVPLPEAEALVEYAQPGAEVVEPVVPVVPVEPAVAPEVAATVEVPAEVDAALERAQAAAKKAREGSKRYKETQARLAETEARSQQAARDAARHQQEATAAKEREAAYLKDPYGELKKRGMTDVQLAERAMRENSPEAATSRLEQQLGEERAARIALENRIEAEKQAARHAQTVQQAEAAYFAAANDAAAYPELATRRPAVQLVAAKEALKQIAANGYDTRYLSNAQIAEAADQWLAGEAKPKAAVVAAKPGLAKPKPSGVTLTNALANTRTVAPAQWDQLTDEQQIAHIAAGLPEPGG